MSGLSKRTLGYMRKLVASRNVRPVGCILFFDPLFPDGDTTYQVVLTDTTIGITDGSDPYTIDYTGKSTRQIVTELSTSPFPVEVRVLLNVPSLSSGDLGASGNNIPQSFDIEDRTTDGKGCIVRLKRWSVTYDKLSNIDVKPPYFEGPSLPWFVRIGNGAFSQRVKGITYKFGVPEYETQVWSETWGAPFVDVGGEQAKFVTPKAIQLSKFPIYFKNNNIVITGTGDRIFPTSIIEDVDTMNGLVYIKEGVVLPSEVEVFYTYLEKSYIYKKINVNAHFLQNPFLLDKYIVFYARPIESNAGLRRSEGIEHVVGESILEAISAIQELDVDEPIALLGAISVRGAVDQRDYNVIDTRSFGGGLHEDPVGKAAELKFKRSQYFFDIGRVEGIPYPGSASIVVEIPPELKEVMPVAEIKRRASKFIAAGVYPVFKFTEDTYNEQFEQGDHSADISLLKYDIEPANPEALSAATGIFGSRNDAADWINHDLSIPISGLYGDYTPDELEVGPEIDQGLAVDYMKLQDGKTYRATYLKGPADAIFSYEERGRGGQWTRRTIVDDREVTEGKLVAGHIDISAEHGYKEVRNFTGFAPYRLDGIKEDGFFLDLVGSTTQIVEDTLIQINTGLQVSEVADVNVATLRDFSEDNPEVRPMIRPFVDHIDTMTGMNFYSSQTVIDDLVTYIHTNTEGDDQFPGNDYNGTYNAMDEISLFADLAKYYINEHSNTGGANDPSMTFSGFEAFFDGDGSTRALECFSGALSIARKALDIDPYAGQHIEPFYNPSTSTTIPLVTGQGNSEIDEGLDQSFYQAKYIKAMGALYAATTMPIEADFFNGHLEDNSSGQFAPLDFSPREIAMSGMANMLLDFNSRYDEAILSGEALALGWLSRYNRIGTMAAEIMTDILDGFESVYYGNDEWAGWVGTGSKTAPVYHATENDFDEFLWDTNLHQGTTPIFFGGAYFDTPNSLVFPSIVNLYNAALVDVGNFIWVNATRGGIINPGTIKFLDLYPRFAQHVLEEEELFTIAGLDEAHLMNVFEIGMGAALKGSLSEDGILIEGGSFKNQQAPFTGSLPSDMLKACGSAIKYYRAAGDTANENKWMAVSQGLFKTITGDYNLAGGYPNDPRFDSSETTSGNPGPLDAYLTLMGSMTGSLTDAQFNEFTGAITTRLS